MLKLTLITLILFLWALQFFKPIITKKPRKNFVIEQFLAILVTAVLVLVIIFGV